MVEVQIYNTNLRKQMTIFVAKYLECYSQIDNDEQDWLTVEIEQAD